MENQKSDGIPWWLVIAMLIFFQPVGWLLLAVKLYQILRSNRRQALENAGQERPPDLQFAKDKSVTSPSYRPAVPLRKKSKPMWMKLCGGLLAFGSIAAYSDAMEDLMWYLREGSLLDFLSYDLSNIVIAGLMMVGGIALLYRGIKLGQAQKRYVNYLSVIGNRPAVSVEELSRTLGYPYDQTEQDLKDMVMQRYFASGTYLNVGTGYLFSSSEIDAVYQRQRREEAAAASQTEHAESGYSGILRNIRRANDAIADPTLSAKIDRLESVTAKILQAVEQDPKKRAQAGTFLDYYLPTTQKLLDAYSQFEAAGVEGKNLNQAKMKIESVMDNIIAGFERQLDALYQADAMDISTDIDVLEKMLHQAEQDFQI